MAGMSSSRTTYRIYRYLVVVVAIAYLISRIWQLTPTDILFIIAAVVALNSFHLLSISLPEGINLTFDFSIYAILLFSQGAQILGWSAILGNLTFIFLSELRGQRKLSLEHALFSGAQFAIAGLLAA